MKSLRNYLFEILSVKSVDIKSRQVNMAAYPLKTTEILNEQK